MNSWLAAPIMIPFATAAFSLLGRNRPRLQNVLALLAAAAHLAIGAWLLYRTHIGGITVLHVGSWQAPFGIALVADHLSALMLLITGVVYLSVAAYSRRDIDETAVQRGYYALLHILVGGISGAFLTGDLFNLFVFINIVYSFLCFFFIAFIFI